VEGTGGGPNQNKTLIQNSRLSQPRFEVSTSTTQVIIALANSIDDIRLLANRYVSAQCRQVLLLNLQRHIWTPLIPYDGFPLIKCLAKLSGALRP
jgi:hypothetical protein